MNAVVLLQEESRQVFSQLEKTVSEIGQELAWATIHLRDDAYLNTNGSIIGIVQHVAVCNVMCGSLAFRNAEIRWRDSMDRLEQIGTSWDATKAYLVESHEYWLSTWAHLTEEDLTKEFTHFSGNMRPGWRLISMSSHHAAYHDGQINLLASALDQTTQPPVLDIELERSYVRDLSGW